MKNIDERRNRFLQDSLSVRMGGLAANLARVGSFANLAGAKDAVAGLIEESKYFIEWTAGEYDVETAVELVNIQRVLTRWHRHLDSIWHDESRRLRISFEAKDISKQLIAKSGLLDQ